MLSAVVEERTSRGKEYCVLSKARHPQDIANGEVLSAARHGWMRRVTGMSGLLNMVGVGRIWACCKVSRRSCSLGLCPPIAAGVSSPPEDCSRDLPGNFLSREVEEGMIPPGHVIVVASREVFGGKGHPPCVTSSLEISSSQIASASLSIGFRLLLEDG